MRVMITRPKTDAEPLAERLRAEGHEVFIEPLLDIEFRTEQEIDLAGVQAVLLTSANGARALACSTRERGVRVICVGEATSQAAKDSGFEDVVSAGGDVGDLAALVVAECDPAGGPLLHVAASAVAGDLAGCLRAERFTLNRAVLYDAVPRDSLSPEARGHIAGRNIDAVMLYSPRTARRFAALVRDAGLSNAVGDIDAVCLSAAVADALDGLQVRRRRIAAHPDQESLLELMGDALA